MSKRGVTLTELIIGSSLILMLLALFTLVFMSSQRRFQLINTICDLQNNALIGMDWFARELAECDSENIIIGISTDTNQIYVCFRSARNTYGTYRLTPEKKPDWTANWLIYYLYPDDKPIASYMDRHYLLVRTPYITVSSTSPPTPAQVDNYVYNQILSKDMTTINILARNVSKFTVAKNKELLYTAFIETRQLFRGKPITFSIDRAIFVEKSP